MKKLIFNKKGFTLIELIIVVAIIALLAAATFVAVNPAKRIGEANDAQRWSDITAIAEAWVQYVTDNGGSAPTTTTDGITYAIANNSSPGTHSGDNCGPTTTTEFLRLDVLPANGYLLDIPDDPLGADTTDPDKTDYYFYKGGSGGMIVVGACNKYSGATRYATVAR